MSSLFGLKAKCHTQSQSQTDRSVKNVRTKYLVAPHVVIPCNVAIKVRRRDDAEPVLASSTLAAPLPEAS